MDAYLSRFDEIEHFNKTSEIRNDDVVQYIT